MRKIIVDKNEIKVVNFLTAKFTKLKSGAIYKALRNKDIRVNNVKINENIELHKGDELTVYITDKVLFGTTSITEKDIIYQDDNILIANKPQDMIVVSENDELGLDAHLSKIIGATVHPCHRLDRNTSGLVIFAKSIEVRDMIFEMIKNHEVKKIYKCTVWGIPKNKKATLKSYLFKDNKSSHVIISDEKKKGYVEIITKYSVLKCNTNNTADLEVELITGKTHQIRAHLAHIGHPIIGDGKYGINEVNKRFGTSWQQLRAYKLTILNAPEKLSYLIGATFTID